jgi:hypothetical protein
MTEYMRQRRLHNQINVTLLEKTNYISLWNRIRIHISQKKLDDPHIINADPKHCLEG